VVIHIWCHIEWATLLQNVGKRLSHVQKEQWLTGKDQKAYSYSLSVFLIVGSIFRGFTVATFLFFSSSPQERNQHTARLRLKIRDQY
jgi:hypothetical protein